MIIEEVGGLSGSLGYWVSVLGIMDKKKKKKN